MNFKEIFSLKEIENDLVTCSLIVLDLDNTLIECKTSFGSYQWIVYRIKEAVQKGEPLHKALEYFVPLWEQLQDRLEMKTIEEDSPRWLEHLKAKGYPLLGLTGRSEKIKKVTLRELVKNNLVFNPPENIDPLWFSDLEDVAYEQGVLFVGPKQCKGKVLSQLLKKMETKPSHIAFVDDQKDYLQKVSEALHVLNFKHTCYQYRGMVEKTKAFNYEMALEEEKQLFKSS